MERFICVTCGTQYAEGEAPPESCPICTDPRQYVPPDGQRWTTLAELAAGHENEIRDEGELVGIAPTRDVNAYLRGTAHATVTDVDYEPFRASYRTHSGARRPAAPSAQRFWVANAEGTGRQTLTWKVRDGSWSIVVMNADGSANVDAGVSAGTDAPWLSAAGWGSLGGGVLLMAVAGALVAVGVRRPRADREPAGLAPAAA